MNHYISRKRRKISLIQTKNRSKQCTAVATKTIDADCYLFFNSLFFYLNKICKKNVPEKK